MRRRSLAAVMTVTAALILALVASACGGSETTVIIRDLSFEPVEVRIKAGEAVEWKNEDRRSHQIMSGAPPVMTDDFASPVLQAGESWSYTFEQPGEYPYHTMTGGLLGWVYVE